MLALPIFPCSHPQSIVGANELNFCVRDGNRWTLIAINTNYMDKSFRFHRLVRSVSRPVCQSALRSNNSRILARPGCSVKRLLNRERPSEAAANVSLREVGDPYRIRTDVKGVRGLCLNHLTNGPWCTFTDSNRGPTD